MLSGSGTSKPKLADGQIEAIRLVKIARDTAVKDHSTAIITLKAVLVTDPNVLQAPLTPLTSHKLVLPWAELDTSGDIADPAVATATTLA